MKISRKEGRDRMIAWMQKHNKYLVITIWIATIAFIGAGFVGWGSYSYGSKATAIAKVGDIEISKEKFDFVYRNIYSDFANRMRGQFDDKKAKELGLTKIAYQQLLNQTLLLNLANEYGVVVSDEELAKEIKSTPVFMKDGKFNKQIYSIYLKNRGMKPKAFEGIVRDDLTISKLMEMLSAKSVDYEQKVVGSILGLQDKVEFTVLNINDIKVDVDDKELKSFWEKQKDSYKTDRTYKLSIFWSDTSDINVTDEELKNFFHKNSFNYTDQNGKGLEFESIKDRVAQDYRIKKGKKRALLDHIALKKGKKSFSIEKELKEGDALLPKELWSKIIDSKADTLLKPKPIGAKYATVKVLKIIEPRVKSFEEAKADVQKEYEIKKRRELLAKKSKELLASKEKLELESGFIGLSEYKDIPKLSDMEKQRFVQELFRSYDKNGVVDLGEKEIVFKIKEQRLESNSSSKTLVKQVTDNSKAMVFENQLIRSLSSRYAVKTFVKGL